MDLEVGAYPVADFYDYWEGKAFLNYGTNVAHVGARVEVLDGEKQDGRFIYGAAIGRAMNNGAQFKTKTYDPADEAAIMAAVAALPVRRSMANRSTSASNQSRKRWLSG